MKKSAPRLNSRQAAGRRYTAPALQKGIEIIELLAQVPGGLTISDIALRLERSMNEVFRIVVVMEAHGWLRKDPDTDLYSVTYQLLELVVRATPAKSLSVVAAPFMERLCLATNQSCHLVVRAGGHGLIILRQENAGLTGGFAVRPGATVDLVTTCSGHVLLAFASPHQLADTLEQIPKPTAWPMTRMQRMLSRVRREGYELQKSLRTAGVTDISYPVRGFDGGLVAALTVPYLFRIDDSAPTTLEQTRHLLADTTRRISIGLGWTPP